MSETVTLGGITVTVYPSEIDGGTPVVQIDAGQDGTEAGVFRVVINDGVIWDADPEVHHHMPCECVVALNY